MLLAVLVLSRVEDLCGISALVLYAFTAAGVLYCSSDSGSVLYIDRIGWPREGEVCQ